jgi:peptidyl-prolyl cis-trans isomerase A (cyclophilin A)
MRRFAFLNLILGWLVFLGSDRALAAPTTNGLYATFTTSKGTFSCIIYYKLVPRTAANFITLAQGNKRWLDYSKAAVAQRKFYDGLTFHRVATNFVIQGGSPNGQGTDDPGYRFKDEFHPSLRHSKAGILSMANSGTNSNGSQFFITLRATSNLDDKHAVFGEVIEGLDIAQAIGKVPTGANERPLTPVVIQTVAIVRIGTEAQNFRAVAVTPALPDPHEIPGHIFFQGKDLILAWDKQTGSEYRFCSTPDLINWRGFYEKSFAGTYINDFHAAYGKHFFSVFETPID